MATAAVRARPGPFGRGGALPWVVLAVASAVAAAYLFRMGRGTTFFYDEWEFLMTRNRGLGEAVVRTHVGHPSLFPVAVYRVLLAVVGLRRYAPYRLALLALHLLVCLLLFVWARRRVGAWVALGPVVALLFFGSAWNDLIWAFQIGYQGSLLGTMGMLVLLDRTDRWRDPGACLCALVAVSSSGLGLPGLAALGVHVALDRRRWRRAWVLVPPALLYVLNVTLFPAGPSQLKAANARLVPEFLARASTGLVDALLGCGTVVAAVMVLAVVAAVAWRAATRKASRAALATLAAMPLSFWVLTALARGLESPDASRYLYPGALFLFLIVAEAAAGFGRWRPAVTGVVAALAGISVWANVAPLREGRDFLIPITVKIRAQLAALEIARPAGVDPAFRPETSWAPDVFAGGYFDAVDRLGSPTYGPEVLATRPNQERYDADRVLEGAGLLPAGPGAPAAGGGPPAVDHLYAGTVATDGPCLAVQPGEGPLTVRVPGPGLALAAGDGPVAVHARRFADVFGTGPVTTVVGGTTVALAPKADASRADWHVQLTAAAPYRVCTAAPPP